MDDCTERADYKPYSFSKLLTAVYLALNIVTVKCNQHKVFFCFGNVNAGTGVTAIPPKFSDTLTLFQPRGQILPTIAEVPPKISQ